MFGYCLKRWFASAFGPAGFACPFRRHLEGSLVPGQANACQNALCIGGGAWSLLPRDFPPTSTVRSCFHGWRDTGLPGPACGDQPGTGCTCVKRGAGNADPRQVQSNVPTRPKGSGFRPEDGWSSAPSHGSANAAGWQRIGRKPARAPKPGFSSPISGAGQGYSQGLDIYQTILKRILRVSVHGDAYRLAGGFGRFGFCRRGFRHFVRCGCPEIALLPAGIDDRAPDLKHESLIRCLSLWSNAKSDIGCFRLKTGRFRGCRRQIGASTGRMADRLLLGPDPCAGVCFA